MNHDIQTRTCTYRFVVIRRKLALGRRPVKFALIDRFSLLWKSRCKDRCFTSISISDVEI